MIALFVAFCAPSYLTVLYILSGLIIPEDPGFEILR